MKCTCRNHNCKKVYENGKSRAEWTGYCSANCLHEEAKYHGYRKGGTRSEYDVLSRAGAIGDLPIAVDAVKAIFKAEPKKERNKGWFWKIGPQTLAKHHDALLKIENVTIEYQRKEGTRWAEVKQFKDAEGATVWVKIR